MNRRQYLQSAAIAGISTSTSFLSKLHAQTAAASDFAFTSAPVLQNPSEHNIQITIACSHTATGWVEYGTTEALGQRSYGHHLGLLPVTKCLHFQLENLKPGTQYFYRVHVEQITYPSGRSAQKGSVLQTDIRSFTTLNAQAKIAKFTVWNDTHENATTLQQLIQNHQQNPSDFLVWNGDISNDLLREEVILQQYLHPVGQAYADRTPVILSRGNHDVRGAFARQLHEDLLGSHSTYQQVLRQGPIGILILDTGEDKPDEQEVYHGINAFADYRSQQQQWLEKAIQDPAFASAPYKVAFMHIPLVWDTEVPEPWLKVWGGYHGWYCEDGFKKWNDLLTKAGVQLVISGHVHRHHFFPVKEGRSYAQLTGGGPRPEEATIISGFADDNNLTIQVKNLSGTLIFEHKLAPLTV